jgi:hypothetical protein
MGRREKPGAEELKVTFEAIIGRQGGKGIFGIEDEADEVARQAKLQRMANGLRYMSGGTKAGDGAVRAVGSGRSIRGRWRGKSKWIAAR